MSRTDLTFTSVGGLNVEVSTTSVSGAAGYLNDTGLFTLGAVDFIAGPLHANVFPANAAESFTYQVTSEMDGDPAHPDGIAGTIIWARVDANVNGTVPILYGSKRRWRALPMHPAMAFCRYRARWPEPRRSLPQTSEIATRDPGIARPGGCACIVDKIDQFEAELANSETAPDERLVALKFLLQLATCTSRFTPRTITTLAAIESR